MDPDRGLPASLVLRHGWRKNGRRYGCERCGADGAAPIRPFYTGLTEYALCRSCAGWLMVGMERKGTGLRLRNDWWGWTRFLTEE